MGRSWQKNCMYYPRRWELAWRFHVFMGSFQLSSVPQRQPSASARQLQSAVSGTRSWRNGSGCSILHWQIYTIVRPRDGKCVCARTHVQYVPQTIVPSRSHRYDVPEVEFKKNSILATLADFCLSGLRRVFVGFANSKSSSTPAHGATLLHKPRFTALYWPSTVKLFKNEGQKLLQTTAQALENCTFPFLFDSWALITTLRHIASTTRNAMRCAAPRSYLAFGDRDRWPGPRPTRPPPVHLQFSSNFTIAISVRVSQKNACQTHSLSIHCEETNLGERKPKKKKKKKVDYRIRNLLSGSSGTSKNRVTGYSMYSFQP